MFGNQGRESRKDELEQDFYGSCSWLLLVLPQLVDIIVAYILFGQCHAVHLYNDSRYICLLMGGLWMSRLLKHNLMEDVFNNENESFMQETKLMENEYSVNLPTLFYYKKKWQKGWINVVNPFRATIVLGTPVVVSPLL